MVWAMSDTAIVATYGFRHEAEFARATLQAAGIDSVMVGDDAGGAYTGLSFARHIKLLVLADELDQARAILADTDSPPAAAPDGA
jgi:hypothetical protein